MRLTRSGVAVLVTGAAIYLLGVALGYPAVTMLGALLLLMIAAAIPWVLWPLRVDVHREIEPSEVERGRLAIAALSATTQKRRAVSSIVHDRVGSGVVESVVPTLRRNQRHRSTYVLPTEQRGIVPVGPLRIERLDPLGLLRRDAVTEAPRVLTVYPRVHLMRPPAGGSVLTVDEGVASEHALEGAGSFQGLRSYLPGDDVRKIHWRTSARTGQLMVRKYVESQQPDTAVVLDHGRTSYSNSALVEEAIDVAASIMTAEMPAPTLRTLSGTDEISADDSLRYLTELVVDADALVSDVPAAFNSRGSGTTVVITGAQKLPLLQSLVLSSASPRRTVFVVLADGESLHSRSAGVVVLQAPSAREIAALWNALV